ncbi:MAG: NAD-dependent epimerase/dehydratase family protein, partial [Erysipelotrichaceae bacterium]
MKYDAFFHLAWEGSSGEGRNNASLQVSNISATLDATKLAYRLGCHTFIGAGSQAEYGRVEGLLRPSTPTNPESGYGIAKLCAGNMSRTLANQLDMNHIWVRILSVYGPYDSEHSMIMSTIKKLLNHEVPSFTKGEQIWDYLYSDDAANALLLLAIKGQPNKTYCLGSGIGRPLYEYIQIIKEVINPMAELAVGALPYGPNQVMHLVADISDLEADIGFTPKTEFKDGIKMIMASINNDMNR